MQGMMDQAIAQSLLSIEAALDDEINRVDNLGEDDLAKIKANRIAEMKKKAEMTRANMNNGHGSLSQIVDQKDFFGVCKNSERVILIFTRNSNAHGKDLLDHCRRLSASHLEARFVWMDAENCPFLTERFNIFMLPTIVCIKDNKVHRQHNGLNDLDGSGKYTTGMLEFLLQAADEMLDDAPLYEQELRDAEDAELDSDNDD